MQKTKACQDKNMQHIPAAGSVKHTARESALACVLATLFGLYQYLVLKLHAMHEMTTFDPSQD